jgi:glycosyltransferase involved in cell wall biosynthesis
LISKAKSPIKVAIDGFWLTKPRGLGRYVQELLFTLVEDQWWKEDVELYVFMPAAAAGIAKQLLISCPGAKVAVGPSMPYPIWEQLVIPWLMLREGVSVIHHPYNTVSAVSSWLSDRRIVTVHDIMFLDWWKSESWYQNLGNIYRTLTSKMIRKRDCVVTISENSAKQINIWLGLSTLVVPNTCRVLVHQSEADSDRCEERRRQLVGGDSRYFIHIGGIAPHKNSSRAIMGFLEAARQNAKLVVLGMTRSQSLLLGDFAENKQIVFPGIIEDKDLICLIKGATALIFPSFH